MNRKELACAAVGAVLGAAGCSPAMKSLAVPAANAEPATAMRDVSPGAVQPHLEEAILSLISGTTRDVSSTLFHMRPKSGWSIASSDPRLSVSISEGHIATIVAPEDQRVHFIAWATISHDSGTEFRVRCHVEGSCD